MIVKIEFISNIEEPWCMMFGNSYKSWKDQAREYLDRLSILDPTARPVRASYSKSNWVGWGGLKWCDEDEFQGCLNREGCQSSDPDNPNPRQYLDMKFLPMQIERIEALL